MTDFRIPREGEIWIQEYPLAGEMKEWELYNIRPERRRVSLRGGTSEFSFDYLDGTNTSAGTWRRKGRRDPDSYETMKCRCGNHFVLIPDEEYRTECEACRG